MRIQSTVLHNISEDMFLRYYPPTSSLHHAHTFDLGEYDEGDDLIEAALNTTWLLTNLTPEIGLTDAPYQGQVEKYRERGNRSTSVSDVIVLHKVEGEVETLLGVFVVMPVGHEGLEFMPDYEAGSSSTKVSAARSAALIFMESHR